MEQPLRYVSQHISRRRLRTDPQDFRRQFVASRGEVRAAALRARCLAARDATTPLDTMQ